MKKGNRYVLISFNGSTVPEQECESRENYWLLLNQTGKLINFSSALHFGNENRVLIQFDQSLDDQGLECHNTHPNSLWILKTDLAECS